MGKFVNGRRMDRMKIDGDKADQYKSFEMAQMLHDRFIETYGSVTCKDIHNDIFRPVVLPAGKGGKGPL